MIFFWNSSNSSGSVSSEVKIIDSGNLDNSWIEDENLGTKIDDGSKDGEEWIKECELFLSGD